MPELTSEFLQADLSLEEVDIEVLTDPRTSEIGRFAITHSTNEVGAFKTPTLRNVALTAPYMHDGSLQTLEEVMIHYNNGGALDPEEEINPWLAGGIRPLDLTDEEIDAVVAFMEALTSPAVLETYDNPDAE